MIDRRIEKQRRLIEALKSYKRGVVQRVFSTSTNYLFDTNLCPEISLSALFSNVVDKGYSDETVLTIVQGKGTIPRDSIERRLSYDEKSVSTYKKVRTGDFILHLRSFEGGLEIANHNGIVSPAYTILRNNREIATGFYYAYFRSYEFINNKLRIAVEGIRDGKSINMAAFWKINIPFPSLKTQYFYANLFATFDDLIAKSELVLGGLDNTKKYLLQQLFI